MEGELRSIINTDWVFVVLVGVSLLFALSRWLFSRQFSALGNINLFLEIKDKGISFSAVFHLLFALLGSLIIWKYVTPPTFVQHLQPYMIFILLLGAVCLYLMLKFLISGLMFLSIDQLNYFNQLIFKRTFLLVWITIPLIIICFLMYFSSISNHYLLYFILPLFILPSIFEYFYQPVSQEVKSVISPYYFILYLCAFEILPFLLLFKYGFGWEII